MFEINKSIPIYKSEVHAEWLKVISKLKSKNDHYLVKFSVEMETTRELRLVLTPVLPGLSQSAQAALVIPVLKLYYASELLKFMVEYPKISGKTIKEGLELIVRIPKKDIMDKMARLSPEVHMERILGDIFTVCGRCRDHLTKQHAILIAYALFGIDFGSGPSVDRVDTVLRGLHRRDFGIKDVRHASDLLFIILGLHRKEFNLTEAETINEIDALLAAHGRPVVRPEPTSHYLRHVCLGVKSSVLYRGDFKQTT